MGSLAGAAVSGTHARERVSVAGGRRDVGLRLAGLWGAARGCNFSFPECARDALRSASPEAF